MTDQDQQQVPISEAMRLAIDHQQAGRLDEAEAIYRAVLESEPTHSGASYNLGLIALQKGRMSDAIPVLRSALRANPDNGDYWLNYAVAVAGSGAPQVARQILLQARERGLGGKALPALLEQVERMIRSSLPATVVETVAGEGAAASSAPNLDALLQLYNAGNYAEVEKQARALQPQFPGSVVLARLLGSSLLAQNRFEAARETMAAAAAEIPGDAIVHELHGLALRRLKRNEEARAALEASLALAPERFSTLLNASANAVSLGDAAEARRYAERALALQPDSVDALRVLADAAVCAGGDAEAVELYRRGLGIDPNAVDLQVNLADALVNLGRPTEATTEIERAVVLRAGYAPAELIYGRALYQLGEIRSARAHFRAASDLAPDMTAAHTAYLFCLAHDETVSADESFAEHLRVGRLIEGPVQHERRAHDNDRDAERGLRVGFVSADLRDHAVAYLIEPIWRALRGGRHRVIAYASQRREDAVSARLRALADDWVRVERVDDAALAERIRADRIDILFDLSGHTVGNRLGVFARKPAPIQVTWMGYPGTTGLTAMDYRFIRGLDEQSGALDRLFIEKLVRFRYRGFEPEASAPPVNPLPALASGRVTFASFNRAAKIGEAAIDLWSNVLHAVPDSTLLIGAVGEERTRERLRGLFAARSIASERLQFRPRVNLPEYLAMHHEVDIVLDTFPYTGGTTTSHALWMGVPVLTLAGNVLQQSQAAAILGLLGLSDWVASTREDYVRKATSAVADLPALDRLRRQLRPKMAATFMDAEAPLREELDRALQAMWRRWCAGLAPESFTVTP